jgi:ATP/maltotriose-dependent transcriptional regulator MalT
VLALLNVLRDLPDRAVTPIIEATEMAERFGYRLHQPHLIDTEGQRLMALGVFDEAVDHFIRARQHDAIRGDVASHALVIGHLGTAWRRRGDIAQALAVYDEAATVAAGANNLYAQLTCASNTAYTQGLAGGTDAPLLLVRLREQAAKAGLGFVANKCSVFRAVLAFRADESPDLAALQTVIRLMLEQGQLNFLSSELCQHAALSVAVCRESRQEAWLPELVSCLAGHSGCETALEQVAALDDDLARLVVDQAAARMPSAKERAFLERLRKNPLPQVRRAARPPTKKKSTGSVVPELTARETRVLELMANGLRNPDIASQLYLSQATVKTYVNRIFRKLGVLDRVGAVLCYRDRMGDPRELGTRSSRAVTTRPEPK